MIFMTGYIYTSSSFLLHIHRGFAPLLLHGLPRFRSFKALSRPTNSHDGPPINMPLSRRTEHSCPSFSALFRLDAGHVYCSWVLRCILLLRTGDASGPGASSHMMFFSSGSSCPEPLCVLQPCSGHDVLLPATSWPH